MATSTALVEKISEHARDEIKRFLELPYRDLDFVVYRFLPPTDKRGLPYSDLNIGGLPASKVWVESFAPAWGEFLLDIGEPVYDVQNYHPLVTRLEGYGLDQGRVKYRNLQQLQFPWGIDGSLPVQIYSNQVFRDDHRLPFDPKGMSRLDLQYECRRRHLSTKGKRSHLIQRINHMISGIKPSAAMSALEDEALARLDSVSLPLHRVLRFKAPEPKSEEIPVKQPGFDVGEIVLVYGTLESDTNVCLVRDYEGNRGRINVKFLQEIEMPFGLKLNRRGLVEILERLGWPDEEDADPRKEVDTVELALGHRDRIQAKLFKAKEVEITKEAKAKGVKEKGKEKEAKAKGGGRKREGEGVGE
ncbi:hypothetical protein EYC80_004702 [Monilinia laxa]|uniref:SAP domain-containing protein n=1 Tax=Monilinia laxa TaxID=61186 RepID=A0A5N6KJ67_MONLA|nr:hypothetical protein EYC80_004702 [Monilinia laxa]